MATAIIISGQARSFERVWDNQFWIVYRKAVDPYFFVSVADDADASKMDLLLRRMPKERVFIEKVEQPTLELPPSGLDFGAYPPSAHPMGILKQLWALNRGWEFFLKEAPKGVRFDMFLRIRPDLHFHWFKWPKRVNPIFCFTPWWSRWGGINDRVAVLGESAAPVYFTTFQRVPEMLKAGAPLHPETLILESMERGHMLSTATLSAWFTTVRKDGTVIGPDPQTPDIIDYVRSG
jgi:hypothetical protein